MAGYFERQRPSTEVEGTQSSVPEAVVRSILDNLMGFPNQTAIARRRAERRQSPEPLEYSQMGEEAGLRNVAESGKRLLVDPRVPPDVQALVDRMLNLETMQRLRQQQYGSYNEYPLDIPEVKTSIQIGKE